MTPLREESRLPTEGWRDWIWAMAPNDTERVNNLAERGPDQQGVKNNKIGKNLCAIDGKVSWLCGIYEWRITEPYGVNPTVVYIGSTCARNGGPCTRMKNRILSYCEHGNHKEDLINEALEKGYELWVRFKPTGSEEEAREEENDLLLNYNYAWNERNNGEIRDIL